MVYSVIDQDAITQLDAMKLERGGWDPRVDHNSGLVYVPGGPFGVWVIRYTGEKLVPVKELKCVENAQSVAVVSTGILHVCDRETESICQVDVNRDMVTARLKPPPGVGNYLKEYKRRYRLAILGDTALVVFEGFNINTPKYIVSMFSHTGMRSVPTPGKLLPQPKELGPLHCLTTDHHSSFLLTDQSTVYVIDANGNLSHIIPIPTDRTPQACTVVLGQLWVLCTNGDIIVMSPQ